MCIKSSEKGINYMCSVCVDIDIWIMFAIKEKRLVVDMYIVQWDALHGLVLFQWVHLVEVTISD